MKTGITPAIACAFIAACCTPVAAVHAGTPTASDKAMPSPYTADTPLKVIAENPQGLAVLKQHMPRLVGGPYWTRVNAMSLNQLKPMSQGRLTDTKIAAILADLKNIKPAG